MLTSESAAARTPDRQALGRLGEQLAADYLREKGFRMLDTNWRHSLGELDIIALDHQTIVAVEVKTRSGTGYGHPFEAITTDKVRRLRRLLVAWVRQAVRSGTTVDGQAGWYTALRVDAIGIVLRTGQDARIEHLRGIGS